MSMNLHAKINGVDCELYQTPTNITYMCTVNSKGSVEWNLSGDRARHALQIYMQWVEGRGNGYWESQKELKQFNDITREHINKIQKMLVKSKKVEVWIT